MIHVRALEREDWEIFRERRLEALRTEPGVFASSFERESALSPEEWRDRVSGPQKRMFGLFDDEQLVGITGVIADPEDPSGATALLVASFIVPAYRGRRLSARLYEARLDWIAPQSGFTRVVVSHRLSNEPSRRAAARFGFAEVARAERCWPDGSFEDEVVLELPLERLRAGLAVRERRIVTIRGRVQGVFFRDTVRRIARRHDVHGTVRNVGDDRLEIDVEGPPARVSAFLDDVLRHPPPEAHIDDVGAKTAEPSGIEGFRIAATARG